MSFDGIINGLFVGYGIYILYTAWLMKTKGELKSGWLVSKNIDLSKSRDKEGYMSYMFCRIVIFAFFTLSYGMLGMYDMYVASLGNVMTAAILIYFVILVWFAIETVRSSNKYLAP